jgi:hypothetical protein
MTGLIPMQMLHNRLPDVDAVEPIEGVPDDDACLSELRDVLLKHGAANRFGIALLHRHFELEPNEVLVERCDPAARTLTTRPARLAELRPDELLTTIWVCDGSSAQACKKFCPKNEGKHQGWKDHNADD